jgi:uncharacterized transporter YbjL
MFIILIIAIVPWVHVYVQTHQMIHIKYVLLFGILIIPP